MAVTPTEEPRGAWGRMQFRGHFWQPPLQEEPWVLSPPPVAASADVCTRHRAAALGWAILPAFLPGLVLDYSIASAARTAVGAVTNSNGPYSSVGDACRPLGKTPTGMMTSEVALSGRRPIATSAAGGTTRYLLEDGHASSLLSSAVVLSATSLSASSFLAGKFLTRVPSRPGLALAAVVMLGAGGTALVAGKCSFVQECRSVIPPDEKRFGVSGASVSIFECRRAV